MPFTFFNQYAVAIQNEIANEIAESKEKPKPHTTQTRFQNRNWNQLQPFHGTDCVYDEGDQKIKRRR